MAQIEEVRQPELRHRILAAAGASVVSAVLVNPLDVVKTRLQGASVVIDRPLPTCLLTRAPSRFPVRWARPSPLSECQSKLPAAAAGAAGGGCVGGGGGSGAGPAAAVARLRPLLGQLPMSSCACVLTVADLGPHHLGAPERCHNAQLYRPVTASGVLHDIVRKEGLTALWRGTDTAVLASIPMVGVYMPLYDYLLERCTASTAAPPLVPTAYAPLVAGSGARTLAVLLVAPLELVRTRQQGSAAGASTAWGALRQTLREATAAAPAAAGRGCAVAAAPAALQPGQHVVRALRAAPRLWRGVGATLARDVPFSAIYWGLLERMRGELLARWQQESCRHADQSQRQEEEEEGLRQSPRPVGHPLSGRAVLAANLLAGSAAGAAAALVTTPFDVVKTQLQMTDVAGGCTGSCSGRGGGAGGMPPASSSPSSGMEVARRILREEGLGGLFRGWAPRVARTAPACAVVVASYEVLKRML